MNKNILVSVIVPIYNSERFLKECIESIASQTFKDFEVLLINDGSTDESPQICDNYSKKYNNFITFHKGNSGVSSTRNYGIERARGKFITFVDSDDVLSSKYLEILVRNVKNSLLSVCKWSTAYSNFSYNNDIKVLNKKEALISVYDYRGIRGLPFCKLFDLSTIKNNNIRFNESISICEDELFVIEYISAIKSNVVVTNSCLYYYRPGFTGALNGRFNNEKTFNTGMLSEELAVKESYKYLLDDKDLENQWNFRLARAKVASERLYTARNIKSNKSRKNRNFIRSLTLKSLFNKHLSINTKISFLLSSISPKLEYKVWRRIKIGKN